MLWLSISNFAEFLGMCVCEQFQNYTLQCKNLRMLYLVEVLGRIYFKPLILQMKNLRNTFPEPEICFPFITIQQEQMRVWHWHESMTLTWDRGQVMTMGEASVGSTGWKSRWSIRNTALYNINFSVKTLHTCW